MVYSNLNKISLVNYNNKTELLDLRKVIRKTSYISRRGNKSNLKYKELDKNLLLVYYTPLSRSFLPKKQLTPVYIPINKDTLEVFGLLQGEGLKKGCEDFQFSNTNYDIIKKFLDYFEKYWNIDRKRWSAVIEYRLPNLTENEEKLLLNFWQKLGCFNNIKIFHRKSLISPYASKKGSFLIRIHSSVLHILINSLLNEIKKLVESEPSYAIYYLKGLLSSDGYVKLRNNSLVKVNIVTSNKLEANHYCSVLSRLSITNILEEAYTLIVFLRKKDTNKYKTLLNNYKINPVLKNISKNKTEIRIYSNNKKIVKELYKNIIENFKPEKILKKSKYEVVIYDWNNFFRLFYLTQTPFGEHSKRNSKFIVGLINHNRTRMLKRFLELPIKFRLKDYTNKFKVNKASAYFTLKKYIAYNILKKTGRIYTLSRKGKIIISKLRELIDLKNQTLSL